MAAIEALVILLLVAVATWGVARFREARAEARHPPEGEIVTIAGRRVHVKVQGKGPDLVLLHGAFGSSRDYTYSLARRLESRYRVLSFDLPGLGYSDHTHSRFAGAWSRRTESPEELAGLLAAAARKLGAERPVVAGHSFGGIVALAWALQQDPAALVLFAGVSMPWPGKVGRMYRLNGSALGRVLLSPLISAWTPRRILQAGIRSSFAPQAAPEGYVAHIGPYMPVRLGPLRATTRHIHRLLPHVRRMKNRYEDLRLPVEILHGAEDLTVPLEVHAIPFSKLVPSARLRVLDGVGHMPHHADPSAAIAAIDRAAKRAGLT